MKIQSEQKTNVIYQCRQKHIINLFDQYNDIEISIHVTLRKEKKSIKGKEQHSRDKRLFYEIQHRSTCTTQFLLKMM